MGEAKRRQQLGLMPQMHPFEAQLSDSGPPVLVVGPQDQRLCSLIIESLAVTYVTGAAWDSQYRTILLLANQITNSIATKEDVQAIPVPRFRHIQGELVMTSGELPTDVNCHIVEGGFVRYLGQKHSFDGQNWKPLPALELNDQLENLVHKHPAFELQGDEIGQYRIEHWQEGRMDIEPDPPEHLLEVLEDIARHWHGQTAASWTTAHHELAQEVGLDVSDSIPQARRSYFELRQPAPLQHPMRLIFDMRKDAEILPLEGASFTLDGETWQFYGEGIEEQTDEFLQGNLEEFLDVELVPVAVYADGRVEWSEDEIPDQHAERVRTELKQLTSAGQPEAWRAWSLDMLSVYSGHQFIAPKGKEIPVPTAVVLGLDLNVLEDDSPLSQTLMESEVLFEGSDWYDLYDDELPPELLPFARPIDHTT